MRASWPISTAGVDPGRRRIDDRHPVAHVRLDDAAAHAILGRRERDAVVDADRVRGVVGLDDAHGAAVGHRHGNEVRQVLARRTPMR